MNVKKSLSLLLAVLMLVSMLTCIVLPAAAATEPISYAASLVNLFTKKASLEGVIGQSNGVFSANDKFYSSDSIAVKEGDVVMFGPARTTQGYQVVSFKGSTVDKSLEINSANIADYTAFTLSDDTTGNMVFCKYTVPADVTAIKVTCEVVASNSFLVTKNQEFTLQNWKDYVAAKYPHTDLMNLYGTPSMGRWAASGLKSSTEYYAPTVQVAKNDVIYFGPANADQGYQLAFYTAAEMTSGTEVKSSANDGYNANNGTLKVVDTFDNGQVIYAYRAKAAGYVGIATPVAYNNFAMITKNQPLTTQNFHNYWDSKADANLYNVKLDVQDGYYDVDGLRKSTANHNGSHSVAVQPGDVLMLSPCWDKTTSFQGVTFDINRNPISKIFQTDSTIVQMGTQGSDGTNPGLILQYTVPEGVYYIRFINRVVFDSAYTIKRVTPLKDSDNLYERDKYPMGLWKANATTTAFQNEYYASAQYSVKAGETIYFGPAQYAQGYQVVFNSADGKVSATVANATAGKYTNPAGSLNVYDTFDNTAHVIYAYRATQDGTVAFPVRSEYHDKFLVTRTPFSVRQFHTYWDAKEGANCYDPILDYIGYVMNSDGSIKSGYHNTGHELAVTPGEVISFGPVQVSQGYDLLTRDATRTPFKKTVKATRGDAIAKTDLTYLPSTGSGEPSDYAIYSYTVPENVYSINIVNRSWTNDFFMIKRGTMTAAEYYEAVGIQPDSVLKGKTGLFVGDSISAAAHDARYMINKGMGAWAGRIGWYYQMEDTNKSVGGSTIAINTGRTYIADQLTSMAENDYDYVIIQGGVNDANLGVAEGALSLSYDPNEFDRNTYAGGLEYIFAKAVELYGDKAAIGYIINYQLPNRATTYNRFGEFVDTAKAACEKWGVQYIDLYNNEEITAAMDLKTNGSLYAQDNLHATERGYKVLYPVIGDWMETLSAHEGLDWKTIADEAESAAKALDLTPYTADSAAAFTAAMSALPEGDEARYFAVMDAVNLLDWTAPLPVSGYAELNVVTQLIYGQAAEYAVSSVEDLKTLHTLTADGTLKSGATVKQLKEIDLSQNADLMIGTEATPFTATYDGQGNTIKGFTLTGAKNTAAFIPFLAGTLKNVTFTDAVTSVNGWTAVAVSNAMNGAVIENVHVKNAAITKTGDNNGLAVLVCQGKGAFTVKDCTVTDCEITITTDRQTYGNVGAILSSDKGHAVSITNCYAVNNTFTLNVNDTATHIGGLAGEVMNTGTVIKNCGTIGNTFTKDYAGIAGVVGITTVAATVENCYTDYATVLIGSTTPVNCYAAVSAADIASGALAYSLKATTGDAWVQDAYPSLNEGAAVTKAEYVILNTVCAVTYTDSKGEEIAPYTAPAVENYVFDRWTTVTAENGDTTHTAKLVLQGDVNDNGSTDVSDVTVLMQYLVGSDVACSVAADANGDGRVSIYDAIILLRALSA